MPASLFFFGNWNKVVFILSCLGVVCGGIAMHWSNESNFEKHPVYFCFVLNCLSVLFFVPSELCSGILTMITNNCTFMVAKVLKNILWRGNASVILSMSLKCQTSCG